MLRSMADTAVGKPAAPSRLPGLLVRVRWRPALSRRWIGRHCLKSIVRRMVESSLQCGGPRPVRRLRAKLRLFSAPFGTGPRPRRIRPVAGSSVRRPRPEHGSKSRSLARRVGIGSRFPASAYGEKTNCPAIQPWSGPAPKLRHHHEAPARRPAARQSITRIAASRSNGIGARRVARPTGPG